MNVKSMIVGFLIAVVASMGTYFLVLPPKGADAAFGGISVKEMYKVLATCSVRDSGSISCARHRFGWHQYSKSMLLRVFCGHRELQSDLETWGRTMSTEKNLKHYEPYSRD